MNSSGHQKDDQSRLTASGLVVGWNDRAIANIPELELHAGEIIVLAGPNGVGKSTTIKTLARQIKPLSGTVKIDNFDIWQMDARSFARTVSYVPQLIEPP